MGTAATVYNSYYKPHKKRRSSDGEIDIKKHSNSHREKTSTKNSEGKNGSFQIKILKDPPSRQTNDGCVCNGLMSTEPGKLIGIKVSFQMNQASICGTMMAAFMLEAMLVNAAFQSALSNNIVA
ncbi:transposable element Tcb2 transposase [Trichonephila clavipes]|uniref:Transposable element Tcb2 transposase n=1 Tax=Trichonephila clavipes TaxID=2585209 RepID=A0A8X6V9E2_TRICX|nr:transposable element Tcb2 transposase [Trichonephila clavipes]